MATGFQNQSQSVPENLKKQLALAVRSTQWSYAIFWFISSRQPGVLEWGDGYYNGDIKTRKTVQSIELNADQLSLQRSEQLRDLYESLSAGESSPQIRRPTAALSPEDLSDTEWYYLVCMSFVFNIGQGLPGRTLATGRHIWLCNAHYADSKVFSRSLLAKSASIQTVVCFPYLGGAIELGVTEPVIEDVGFIQHIKTSFLDLPNSIISSKSNPGAFDLQTVDTKLFPTLECEQLDMISPDNSANGFEPSNQPTDGSFMANVINRKASQVQSWQLLDDDFDNCVHQSLNSSDCISETFIEHEKIMNEKLDGNCLQDVQKQNDAKLASLDDRNNDLHYQSVLSALLKTSHQLMLGPHFRNSDKKSSFTNWKRDGLVSYRNRDGTEQKLLKKVLFDVPQMYDRSFPADTGMRDGILKLEADEIPTQIVSEKKRWEKINERFYTLKSMIPSIKKVDQVSILDDTIEYLQELERRVQDLESCRDSTELDVNTKTKPQDTVERTSDNYGNDKNTRKQSINKRKACDIDNYVSSTDNAACGDITVSINDMDVAIEIRCPWREGILLDVMDAVSNLCIDCHTVQSSNNDGILSVTIKSKQCGSTVPSPMMIKQALQRVAWKI